MMWGGGPTAGGYGGWGFGLFGVVFMVVFWAAIIAGIVLVVRWLIHPTHGGGSVGAGGPAAGGGNRALDILAERYAKGEITKEQFDLMKRDLTGA